MQAREFLGASFPLLGPVVERIGLVCTGAAERLQTTGEAGKCFASVASTSAIYT